MKLNNKGFAITSIIYSMLILFLTLVVLIIGNLASRKAVFDKQKEDILDKFNQTSIETLCTAVTSSEYGNVPTVGQYNFGDEYICELGDGIGRTFYVLEETANDVILILDKNYDSTTQPWCNQNGSYPNDVACNADGLTEKLNEIKAAWSRLDYNQIGLPSSRQILATTGYSDFATYEAGNNQLGEWLIQDINGDTPPYGYWMSEHYMIPDGDGSYLAGAFIVRNDEILTNYYASEGTLFGVRPTIKISKDSLKNNHCILYDSNSNLSGDTGEILDCADEKFYVIPQDTTNLLNANINTISALAMYNLNIADNDYDTIYPNPSTYGLQDLNVRGGNSVDHYGVVRFATNQYWGNVEIGTYIYDKDQANIGAHLANYKNRLNQKNINIKDITLISREQLEYLGCNFSTYSCINSPEFVYSTSYWTGSLSGDDSVTIDTYFQTYTLELTGEINRYVFAGDFHGVRPVIIVNKSDLIIINEKD